MPNTVTLPKRSSRDAVAGRAFVSACVAAVAHFRNALPRDAAYALAADRMFCVALVKPPRTEWRSPNDFYHVASVGLIRACVGRSDGTSNLVLQGLHRVRLSAFAQEQPFPIATIEPLVSIPAETPVQAEALAARLLDYYEKFKGEGRCFPEKLDRYLSELSDPEMLADLMAATFITDSTRRQQVLEQISVTARLRLAIDYLHDESGDAAA